MPLLDPEAVHQETQAIRQAFLPKRERMLQRAEELGMAVNRPPDGTFYVFVSLEGLPEPLSDGMQFFREALDHGVITVPGVFFDVNPGGRRAHHISRFRQHLRLSFGPEMAEVERGLDRLEGMIRGT